LKEWEDVGIIFEVDNPEAEKKRSGGKFYRKMLPI
jgi:hypothetical protein